MSFAKNIRKQRERLGLSVQQEADQIGVTKGAVQNWERDREGKTGKRKHPKREHMQKLADLYHQPIELLYRWAQEDDEQDHDRMQDAGAPPANREADTLMRKADAVPPRANEPKRKMKQPNSRPNIATPKKDLVFCGKRIPESNCSVSLTEQDRMGHTLVLGASGTGKTECVMLPMLYQDMKDYDTNLVVMDAGSPLALMAYVMAGAEGRPAEFFDPLMSLCPTFDPLQDMRGHDIYPMLKEAFEFYLRFSDSEQPTLDEEWACEKVLKNCISVLLQLSKAGSPDAVSLLNLAHLVELDEEGFRLLQAHRTISTSDDLAFSSEVKEASVWFRECYQDKNGFLYDAARHIRGLFRGLLEDKYLQHIFAPTAEEMAVREHLSVREALESNTIICINIMDYNWAHLATCKLLSHNIASVCGNCLPKNGGPIYWYIDEANVFLTREVVRALPYLGQIKTGVIAAMRAVPHSYHAQNILSIFKNVAMFPGAVNEETAMELAKRGGNIPAEKAKKHSLFKKADPEQKELYERIMDWGAQSQIVGGEILFRRQNNSQVEPLSFGYVAPLDNELRDALGQYAQDLKKRFSIGAPHAANE